MTPSEHHRDIEGLLAARRIEEARTAAERGLLAYPTDERIAALMGMALWRLGDAERAEGYFRRAVTLRPKFWEAGAMLVRCLVGRGAYDDAYDLVSELLHDANPNSAELQRLEREIRPHYRGRLQAYEKSSFMNVRDKYDNR